MLLVVANEPVGRIPLKETQGDIDAPQYAAISLGMRDWTDAVNHPEWQRGHKILWGPDRLYTTFSRYKFSVD